MECDDLGDPVYEPGSGDAAGDAQIADWDERLSHAAGFLPPPPPFDGVLDYLLAYQSVGSTLNELRRVPVGTGSWPTPFQYQWEQRFNTATMHLSEARTTLDSLP